MDSIRNVETAKRSLYLMNSFVLLVHVCLLFVFTALHVTVMAYVNIASVICYCLCYLLIRGGRVRGYIVTAFVEILLHTILAVLCVGCDLEFQLYFIGIIAIALFSEYFAVHIDTEPINGIALSIVSSIMFIASVVIDRYHTPYYLLGDDVVFKCRLFNVILALVFVVTFFSMFTKIASRFEHDLARQATHDNLTGLINRHYLTRYMNELAETQDLENSWIAILDIDDFKDVNDTYGHLCGDFVLRSISDMIQRRCGNRIVCRWGGEEFMIVGVGTEGGSSAGNPSVLLEDIRRNIAAEEFVYGDKIRLHLTVTIGMAHCQKGQPLDAWVSAADKRLYHGKQTGKNKVVGAET